MYSRYYWSWSKYTVKSMNITELNDRYSIQSNDTTLSFRSGEGGIPVMEIGNQQASAAISLQGAHVLSWSPAGQQDLIWVSDDASFAIGKSVRGGIPICWPWFGAHDHQANYPAHGFARTVMWQVTGTEALSAEITQITFKLETEQLDQPIQAMWPWPTTLEYRITISDTLTLELISTNHSDETFTIGQALHTYFRVDDVSKTLVTGLEGKDYLDKTDDFKRKTQSGAIHIASEVDRVYLNTDNDVVIDDQQRKVHISKQGSHSTVVWNPWQFVANKMGDLGQDGYLNMLCVESANAADDTVVLALGKSHQLSVKYEIKK